MAVTFHEDSDSVDVEIHVGDIVVIKDYGNTKWLVCKGWYSCKNQRLHGWYFQAIPNGRIVGSEEVDLDTIKVLSSEAKCDHKRPHDECEDEHHHHHHHRPHKIPCDNSFVTVDTIKERNMLGDPYPPDGKIVRVNDVKGETRYYEWNDEELRWIPWSYDNEINGKIEHLDTRVQVLEEWVLIDSENREDAPTFTPAPDPEEGESEDKEETPTPDNGDEE